MTLALIVSSFVAASGVGGFAQALVLGNLGVEPVVAPTVLFGRHPGWGAPGGGPVSPEMFEGVLSGTEAHGTFSRCDIMLTGYFASAEQVRIAAESIDRVRQARADVRIIVDPILGDHPKGLYVRPEVERTIVAELLPRADLLAPNAWELERLTGLSITDAQTAANAARSLGCPVLASSIPVRPKEMAVLYVDSEAAWLAVHGQSASAPNGTGDLLTALFAAGLMDDLAPSVALSRAVGGVVDAVDAALALGSKDLPLVRLGARFRTPAAQVRLERLM